MSTSFNSKVHHDEKLQKKCISIITICLLLNLKCSALGWPQVNGIDLRQSTHDEAINVLRQTPQRVRLVVYRDEAQYKEDDLWDSFTVELRKKPGQGLGLSIVGRRCEIYHEGHCKCEAGDI